MSEFHTMGYWEKFETRIEKLNNSDKSWEVICDVEIMMLNDVT